MPDGRPRILVVDDDEDRLAVCRAVLDAAGYDVEGIRRPAAIEAGGAHAAAIVAAEHLIEALPSSRIPLIVLARDPGDHLGDHRAAVWLGVPIAPSALLRGVEDLLGIGD